MELDARKKAIELAHEEWESLPPEHRVTMTVQYHGQPRVIPVITISPNVPLLNHDNYRLAAQLEDHPDRDVVLSSPLTPGSQDLLAKLLSSTDEFKALKTQLSELKQREPGLITREGLLVNGNTRAVALRELSNTGLLVGLLPPSISGEDVLNLQVELQVLRLVHQDYTFTNELLLIDKLQSLPGADIDGVARKLGWKPGVASRKKIEQKNRILRLIKEIRHLHSAGMLPYSFFDGKSEMLMNLDESYEKLKLTNFQGAEKLKWHRIQGMLFGLTKDQVRTIDDKFVEDQIQPRIPKNEFLTKESSTENKSSGIFGSSSDVALAKEMTQRLINVAFDASGQEQPIVNGPEHELGLEMQLAAENKINEKRLNQILTDPIKHFREARIKFEDISGKLSGLANDESFDFTEFAVELEKVSAVLATISDKAKKFDLK
jgi:hypothetical protein